MSVRGTRVIRTIARTICGCVATVAINRDFRRVIRLASSRLWDQRNGRSDSEGLAGSCCGVGRSGAVGAFGAGGADLDWRGEHQVTQEAIQSPTITGGYTGLHKIINGL